VNIIARVSDLVTEQFDKIPRAATASFEKPQRELDQQILHMAT